MKRHTFQFLIFLSVIVLISCQREEARLRVGEVAPDFSLPNIHGQRLNLKTLLKEETIVLNFFATWCPSCRKELPQLEEISQGYGSKGVKIIGIDIGESRERVLDFARRYGIDYPILLDQRGEVARTYGIYGVPSKVLVDKEGKIRFLGYDLKRMEKVLKTISSNPNPSFQVDSYALSRKRMVEKDLKGRDIADPEVLRVMGKVPRHLFVKPDLKDVAYADHPLPIGEGQTISQPYIVALMTQILKVKPGEKILEIGTGSGYQAAILAELGTQVYTIEIKKNLAREAASTLKRLGYKGIKVRCGDGYFGWQEGAPFDAIIVTCALNHIPPPLTMQLKEGGRLLLPLGSTTYYQTLTLITKIKGELEVRHLTGVVFVPMTGEAQKR